MPSPAVRTALVVRDLLGVDESTIRIGRSDWERETFDTEIIAVDVLGTATAVFQGQRYDGTAEQLQQVATYRVPMVIDFFGPDAFGRAARFRLAMQTEKAQALQAEHQITLGHVATLNDLSGLVGTQRTGQVQATLTALYTTAQTDDVKRIDTTTLDFLWSK